MTDTDRSRRPFRLADLFLLTVGFAIGFAMLAAMRADAVRRSELQLPEDVGSQSLDQSGLFELLAFGLTIGITAAFPLVRVNEAWNYRDSRRLRVTDTLGFAPAPLLVAIMLTQVVELDSFFGPAVQALSIFGFLYVAAAALLSMPIGLALMAEFPRQGSWIDYLGVAAPFSMGLLFLRSISLL